MYLRARKKFEGCNGNGVRHQGLLLDAVEATNENYGYKNTDTSDSSRQKSGSGSSWWWLRSPDHIYTNYVGVLSNYGVSLVTLLTTAVTA